MPASGLAPSGGGGAAAATPAAAHLARLSPASRASVRASLDRAARVAQGGGRADGVAHPWHRRPPETLAAVRAALADAYAPATANASVAAVRGALRCAWLAGRIERDALERALAALPRVPGRAAPGRALATLETRRLFETAARQNPAAAARDGALLALACGMGLRRAELAAARLDDLDLDARTLLVRGKGRRERIGHLGSGGCVAALSAWIRTRGDGSGPLLRAVRRGGRVLEGGMSPRAVGKRVRSLARRAGLGDVSPHTLRRSFATALLDAGCDLALAADLMGHARTDTTRLYDRRGRAAARIAADSVPVPYVPPPA